MFTAENMSEGSLGRRLYVNYRSLVLCGEKMDSPIKPTVKQHLFMASTPQNYSLLFLI